MDLTPLYEEIDHLERLIRMSGSDPELVELLATKREELAEWKKSIAAGETSSLPSVVAVVAAPEDLPSPAISATYAPPDQAVVARFAESLRHKQSSEVDRLLAKVLEEIKAKPARCDELRTVTWAANIILTERDNFAPCVRSQFRLGGFLSRAAMLREYAVMLNDRQLFDLQFAHKHGLGNPKRKWERLLRGPKFDVSLASEFVATVGRPDNKIDALRLAPDEQMFLGGIRAESIRKRWERIAAAADRLEERLRVEYRLGVGRVSPENETAWREEFIALTMAGGKPAVAAKMLPRLFARTKPANQLANRKLDLRRKGFPVH